MSAFLGKDNSLRGLLSVGNPNPEVVMAGLIG